MLFLEGLTHLEAPHVSWVARVLEAILIALQEKLEEKPEKNKKSISERAKVPPGLISVTKNDR